MVHKDKFWIKFNDLDIECICAYDDIRCPKQKRGGCHLYLAKFIQLDEEEKVEEKRVELTDAGRKLEAQIKQRQEKFKSEVRRSLDKMRKFKI